MSTPQQIVTATVEKAREEVASLREFAKRLEGDSSAQAQKEAADLKGRLQHAEGLLAKADHAVRRIRAHGRLPSRSTVAVPPSVRARKALAVLLSFNGSPANALAPPRALGRKRPLPTDSESGRAARSVKAKIEPIEAGAGKGVKNDEKGEDDGAEPVASAADIELILRSSVGGADVDGIGTPAVATGVNASGGLGSNAADTGAAGEKVDSARLSRSALARVPLTDESFSALARFAAKSCRLNLTPTGNRALQVRCGNVFHGAIWFVEAEKSMIAKSIDDRVGSKSVGMSGLVPDHVVVCGVDEGVPKRWTTSKHAVFQLFSERAQAAARFYWAKHSGSANGFVDLCTWLAAHDNIFTQAQGDLPDKRRLAFDASRGVFLPACIRPFSLPSEARFPRGSIPPQPATR